jgi:hypothetical protein
LTAEFLPSSFYENEGHFPKINNCLLAEITARTQNEQQLYSALHESEIYKKQMQTTIHDLNEQLKVIKLEIEHLKLNPKQSEITSLEEVNDDGDIPEDTKWVLLQNSRKIRKIVEVKSPEQCTDIKDKASPSASQSQTKGSNKPRPIMITGVENHEDLTSIIEQAIGDENYQSKLMNNGITKVNVSSDYAYRILTISLKANHIRWYTYENMQIRNISHDQEFTSLLPINKHTT